MRPWPNVVSCVLLIALVALGPAAAAAQADGKAQARRLVDEGSAAYERGDFRTALASFEEAFAAYPSPKLWFNIGQAQRALGRPVEALHAFRRFLSEATDAPPDTRTDAEVLLAGLQRGLGRLRIVCDTEGAEVTVDGKPVGIAPISQLLWATPGPHTVIAVAGTGRSARAQIEVQPGAIRTLQLGFAPEPAPTAEAAAESAHSRGSKVGGWWLGRTWTWVAGGSAVLLAGGAVTSGLLMQAKIDELDQSCGNSSPLRQGCSPSERDAVALRRDVANGLWIAAGAAVLTAGVLFFVEGHPVAVAPMPGSTAGLQARVGF